MTTFSRWMMALCLVTFALVGASASAGEASANSCSLAESTTLEPLEEALEVATKAVCTADCQGAGSASCSGSTCTAVNRNCDAGQPGYARCGSTTYYCAPCPGPICYPSCRIQCGITGGLCSSDGICYCY